MIDIEMLKEEQLKLAKKINLKDSFEEPTTIGGADQAFHNDNVISAIVVCDYNTMEVIEKSYSIIKNNIPYIPGFLAYREGPAISEAYAKTQTKPSIMIFDGNGILHPRRIGLASHMGVLLEQPSIGVAKQLLIGELKDGKVYVNNEVRAEIVVTKEHSKPLYISPGHKISLNTSVEIVKKCIRYPHKLPEPLHLAHRYANEIRAKILSNETILT